MSINDYVSMITPLLCLVAATGCSCTPDRNQPGNTSQPCAWVVDTQGGNWTLLRTNKPVLPFQELLPGDELTPEEYTKECSLQIATNGGGGRTYLGSEQPDGKVVIKATLANGDSSFIASVFRRADKCIQASTKGDSPLTLDSSILAQGSDGTIDVSRLLAKCESGKYELRFTSADKNEPMVDDKLAANPIIEWQQANSPSRHDVALHCGLYFVLLIDATHLDRQSHRRLVFVCPDHIFSYASARLDIIDKMLHPVNPDDQNCEAIREACIREICAPLKFDK